jgi:S-adenosylmethionine decarboxylase
MKHIVFTLYGCQSSLLDDEDYIRKILWEATHHMGATFLKTTTHKFDPQGVTAVTLLAESHISIHTWPEKGTAVCDIFTCGKPNPRKGAIYLGRKLQAKDFTANNIDRYVDGDFVIGNRRWTDAQGNKRESKSYFFESSIWNQLFTRKSYRCFSSAKAVGSSTVSSFEKIVCFD